MASLKNYLSDFLSDATKFAYLACTNTLTSSGNMNTYKLANIEHETDILVDRSVSLIKIHFPNVATEMVEPIIKYHVLYNKVSKKDVSSASF